MEDAKQLRYKEDGRFDFAGDINGVLDAVRGKDQGRRGKKVSTVESATNEPVVGRPSESRSDETLVVSRQNSEALRTSLLPS